MDQRTNFTYRFGLSFPGSIQGPNAEMIDFRQVVREIADRMKATCDNNADKVLYDHYHQGLFARPALDEFLPAEYLKCELIVVFLCKEYADREWCKLEWKVIQELAANRSLRHRVMYLWHGDPDETVLERLGLSSNSNGFLNIANLTPNEIWDWVFSRYTSGQSNPDESGQERSIALIGYHKEDGKWLDRLNEMLAPYKRAGMEVWSEQEIKPGKNPEIELSKALASAKVAILLVTPALIASDDIEQKILTPLLQKAERGDVSILWIPIKRCNHRLSRIKDYSPVWDADKPLSALSVPKQEEALVLICEAIAEAMAH